MTPDSWRKGLRVKGRPRKKKTVLQNSETERLIKEIRSNISQKSHFPREMREHLYRWFKVQLKHGLDLEDIAGALNDMKIPTMSGVGVWRSDTVEYLAGRLIK